MLGPISGVTEIIRNNSGSADGYLKTNLDGEMAKWPRSDWFNPSCGQFLIVHEPVDKSIIEREEYVLGSIWYQSIDIMPFYLSGKAAGLR